MLLVRVYVCVRAQTEQLSGVVDRLRKKKNERKKKKRKKKKCFIRYATTNISLSLPLLVFLYREAIVAAGCYLSRYIWRERTHSCFNRR